MRYGITKWGVLKNTGILLGTLVAIPNECIMFFLWSNDVGRDGAMENAKAFLLPSQSDEPC